jgi:hypothetical protein
MGDDFWRKPLIKPQKHCKTAPRRKNEETALAAFSVCAAFCVKERWSISNEQWKILGESR